MEITLSGKRFENSVGFSVRFEGIERNGWKIHISLQFYIDFAFFFTKKSEISR